MRKPLVVIPALLAALTLTVLAAALVYAASLSNGSF